MYIQEIFSFRILLFGFEKFWKKAVKSGTWSMIIKVSPLKKPHQNGAQFQAEEHSVIESTWNDSRLPKSWLCNAIKS